MHAESIEQLIYTARSGDEAALAELFNHYKGRLRQMIDIRMDGRLRSRVDPSDVLQEAFIDLANKLPAHTEREELPFSSGCVWSRANGF